MIDVIAAEPSAHQFLKQICFLIGALGRTKPGQSALPAFFSGSIANFAQLPRGQIERLLPARLAEHFQGVGRVHDEVGTLGHTGLADKRFGQTLGMGNIIEAIAALDAQPPMIRRTIAPLDGQNAVVPDLVGELTTNPAIGAD